MSYPARSPIGTMGIDGKTNAACRRPRGATPHMVGAEAAAA